VGRSGLNEISIRPVVSGDLPAVAGIFAFYVENTVTTFEETPRPVRDWEALAVRLLDLELPFLVRK
jgi:L-amino acid N-acyltransferase YncA